MSRGELEATLVPSTTPTSPTHTGDTIGQGGQAIIRRFHDPRLDRVVAMKSLRPELTRVPEEVGRFIDEARITAGLEHPHVPAVHELGVADDGTRWFTMKLVEGETLDALLRPSRFDPADDFHLYRMLQVLIKVCEAVSFAHSRGVIHCDLKPSNVMVGSHGQVYVMDWGISKRREALPRGDAVLGTIGYMSPEQARGDNASLDARTDVYALGAMLYRVVVGFPPYHAQSRDEALGLAKSGAVFPPEQQARGRSMSRRLLDIAVRALARRKEDRTPSVDALASELESYVRGAARFPEVTFAKGDVIVREGEPADCAFLIRAGSVEASRKVKGRKKVLGKMKVGELFGESAILAKQKRTATVRALEPTRLAVLSQGTLAEELGRTDVLSLALTSVLRRFHALERRRRR